MECFVVFVSAALPKTSKRSTGGGGWRQKSQGLAIDILLSELFRTSRDGNGVRCARDSRHTPLVLSELRASSASVVKSSPDSGQSPPRAYARGYKELFPLLLINR